MQTRRVVYCNPRQRVISYNPRHDEIKNLALMIDAPGETLAQDLARDAIARGLTLGEFRRRVATARRDAQIRGLAKLLNAEHMVYQAINDDLTVEQFRRRVAVTRRTEFIQRQVDGLGLPPYLPPL